MSTTISLITAEEYAALPDTGRPTELVRGRVVESDFEFPRHGFVCGNIAATLGKFVRDNDSGRAFCRTGVNRQARLSPPMTT